MQLINDAIRQAPCVLLIDEINAVLPRRRYCPRQPLITIRCRASMPDAARD